MYMVRIFVKFILGIKIELGIGIKKGCRLGFGIELGIRVGIRFEL